jgi:hypothetical protein
VAEKLKIPKDWVRVLKSLAERTFRLTLGSSNAAILAVAASVNYFGHRYLMNGNLSDMIDGVGSNCVSPGVPGIWSFARNTDSFFSHVNESSSSSSSSSSTSVFSIPQIVFPRTKSGKTPKSSNALLVSTPPRCIFYICGVCCYVCIFSVFI